MMGYCKRKSSLCFKKKSAPFHCFSFFFFFFWFCLLLAATSQGIRCPSSNSKTGFYLQDFDKKRGKTNMEISSFTTTRRILSGPGSSPPRCTSKCGNCIPCKPVHVPVPPGTPVTTEYYPEAWRCKCGNKLYMP